MITKPLVSIIIPTYNSLAYLKKCIISLLNQTVDSMSYEIIIVDDGSTDNTEEYVKQLIKKYSRPKIHYYKQKNSGPATARNLGAKYAIGKYLAFTDSDCEPTKDWIKDIIKNFNRTNIDVICGHTITVYKNKTQWKGIVSAGMNSDFSWKRSAGEYVKLYEKVREKIENQI